MPLAIAVPLAGAAVTLLAIRARAVQRIITIACAVAKGLSRSPASATDGSMGREPRKGTPMSSAIRFPPPERRMCVTSPHLGQTKPLMFSTTPRTFMPTWAQKVMDLRTSMAATRCGVVTTTAPSMGLMSWQMERGSSPVPGGASMIR